MEIILDAKSVEEAKKQYQEFLENDVRYSPFSKVEQLLELLRMNVEDFRCSLEVRKNKTTAVFNAENIQAILESLTSYNDKFKTE